MKIKFLNGKKVFLRPVLKEDINGDYLRWINDRENDAFTEHAQFPHSNVELLQYAQSKWEDRSCIWLAIIEIETGKHVGNIELRNINWVHRSAEYSILIDAKSQGKGLGKEASQLLLKHAFDVLNLHRVSLGVREDNKKAILLYEKLGFSQEGVQRKALLRQGAWKNIVLMAIFSNSFNRS